MFDDKSDNVGSGSGSPGTCTFQFCSGKSVSSGGKSVGGVSGVGSGVFIPTGIESIGDVFPLFVFLPRGVESKGGRFTEFFGAQNIYFPSEFQNQFWHNSFALTSS